MPGIYIHIPFCIKKCNYCDFASFPSQLNRQSEYIDALLNEMQGSRGVFADTVYIGGGTPTCLDCGSLERLLNGVRDIFYISDDAEFTVEANPGTVDVKKAEILKKYGVNRVSMGAQSFNDKELAVLGRIHNSDEICSTYELLRNCGFDNINLDVMYAVCGQTIESLSTSLDKVLNLEPEHISCYGLKYEEGTPLYKMLKSGEIEETDEDTFADMYELICKRLRDSGYIHYEISNFAKKGRQCRHNLKYWNCEDYLGFGVSAASCTGLRRFTHSSKLSDYFNGYALSEDYTMSMDESMREFVILGLRVIKNGVNKREFMRRYSVSLDEVFGGVIQRFSKFLINGENSLKLRENAYLVSNSIMCEFIK